MACRCRWEYRSLATLACRWEYRPLCHPGVSVGASVTCHPGVSVSVGVSVTLPPCRVGGCIGHLPHWRVGVGGSIGHLPLVSVICRPSVTCLRIIGYFSLCRSAKNTSHEASVTGLFYAPNRLWAPQATQPMAQHLSTLPVRDVTRSEYRLKIFSHLPQIRSLPHKRKSRIYRSVLTQMTLGVTQNEFKHSFNYDLCLY